MSGLSLESGLEQLKAQGYEPIDSAAQHVLSEIDASRADVDRLFVAGFITFGEHTNIVKRMRRKITKFIKPIKEK